MKEIPLTQGKITIVDDEDFEVLNQYKWFYALGYAKRSSTVDMGIKRKHIMMHRVIVNAQDGTEVDHINLDKLDNRRDNLRTCSHSQNQHNRGKYLCNTTGFKGVVFKKSTKKFSSSIRINRKLIHLRYYTTALEAAKVYDEASMKFHGKFARINL